MENNQSQPQAAEAPKKPRNKAFPIVFGLIILIGGTYGFIEYQHGLRHAETDDAQLDALISPVIPRVSGYIKEIKVQDNQMVHKGDTLVVLDDRDYQIALEEAEAGLASAQGTVSAADAGIPVVTANVSTAESNVNTVDAQIATAKVNVWRTTQDYNRYNNLIQDHTITQQQYDDALAAKQTAEHQLDVLIAQKQNATRQTAAVGAQRNVTAAQVTSANAGVKQRQAAIDNAKLNLSYTVITASVDGQLSRVNLQPGQFLQAGQALFNIVPANSIWVVANFKETQLTKMKVGQKVIINVDAYPGHDFEAKVSSFSPATGSKFSLLPPDNASGNFVKVVQRLPVKIEFTNLQDDKYKLLRAGMNVNVDVHLTDN